jgi:hypothetical protein
MRQNNDDEEVGTAAVGDIIYLERPLHDYGRAFSALIFRHNLISSYFTQHRKQDRYRIPAEEYLCDYRDGAAVRTRRKQPHTGGKRHCSTE